MFAEAVTGEATVVVRFFQIWFQIVGSPEKKFAIVKKQPHIFYYYFFSNHSTLLRPHSTFHPFPYKSLTCRQFGIFQTLNPSATTMDGEGASHANLNTHPASGGGDGGGGPAVGVQINHSRLPDFLQSVNLKYVKLGYHYLISHLLTLCLIPVMIVILIEASQMNPNDIRQLWIHLQYNLVSVIVCSTVLVFGSTVYIMTRPKPVYLVDYSCYRAPDHLKAPYERFMRHSRLTGDFDESSLEFQRKILERSGLGEETYVPEAMHCIPPTPSMAAAREGGGAGYVRSFR